MVADLRKGSQISHPADLCPPIIGGARPPAGRCIDSGQPATVRRARPSKASHGSPADHASRLAAVAAASCFGMSGARPRSAAIDPLRGERRASPHCARRRGARPAVADTLVTPARPRTRAASVTTSHRVSADTRAGRPLRGRSSSVLTRPSSAKRSRHCRTVSTWQPALRPISAFDSPCAASTTILARCTSRASTHVLRASASNSSRIGGARRSRCAFGPGMPMRSFSHFLYSRALSYPAPGSRNCEVTSILDELRAAGTSDVVRVA